MLTKSYLLCIGESIVPILLASISGGSVGIQDMVLGIESNSLGEEIDGSIIVFGGEGLVALVLESCGLLIILERAWKTDGIRTSDIISIVEGGRRRAVLMRSCVEISRRFAQVQSRGEYTCTVFCLISCNCLRVCR
jgi:hypothetical protein